MSIIYILLVLLIVTRLFGEISERFGHPALLGELISGICLGVIVHHYDQRFIVLANLADNKVFAAITDLGIFFLMLLGGMELQPGKLLKSSKGALVVALFGMLLPFGLGAGLGYLTLPQSALRNPQILFLGTVLAVTAVPVSIRALMDLGKLDGRVGQLIVSAAVIDDTLSLILLAILTAILKTGSAPDLSTLGLLLGKVVVFFIIAGLLGYYLFPRVGRWLKKSKAEEFEFSVLLIAAMSYSLIAEAFGMHFILGAFLAGLFFRKKTINEKIFDEIMLKVRGLTVGFFAPIFFASIGLNLDLIALKEIPGFVLVLILIACIGKVFGAGLSSRMIGLSMREATAVGIGMNARGAVELIIADIAMGAGMFSVPEPASPVIENMFSAVVIMAIVTTLVTPPALKWALQRS